MTPRFDLLEEGWIPCLPLAGGLPEALSLRETLSRAHEIQEVSHASPLVTAAIHRLLLAVLHRVFGPKDRQAWRDLWQRGAWETDALDGYFASEPCRGRFDLFDEQRPFYQCASLDFSYAVPVSVMVHPLATGNNTTLFDHSQDVDPPALAPPEAAMALLAYLSYAVGGLLSFEKGQDRKLFGSAAAAPLVKGALVLVRGKTLFHTLMLNLHAYDPASAQPFPTDGVDEPLWERDAETRVETRLPRGYLDLLTWPSRRVRLAAQTEPGGGVTVRQIVAMKGAQFPAEFSRRQAETMVAFQANPRAAAGADPWPAVSFRPDRALWRDSLALVQAAGTERARPKVFDWLSDLVRDGVIPRSQTLTLDLLGLSVDRAIVLLWRHERLPLPLAYLDSKDLRDELGAALRLAEGVGGALRGAVWELAKLLIAPQAAGASGSDQREPKREQIEPVYRSLAVERGFWWRMELPFKEFLTDLPHELNADEDNWAGRATLAAARTWRAAVRAAADDAFDEIARGLDATARTLRAVARAERHLRSDLGAALHDYLPYEKKEGVAA